MNTTQPHRIVCEWGGDHRETGKPTCAIREIPKNLNEAIQRFLHYQAALEFGRKGSMGYCLRDIAINQYSETIRLFRRCQSVSEGHPECHLAQEIFRLRKHFDEVTKDYASEKDAFARADPTVYYVLPLEFGHEKKALLNANFWVRDCYEICFDIVECPVRACLPPMQETKLEDPSEDPYEDLAQIDTVLGAAADAIKLLPDNVNATARDLTKTANQMCKDARRVLCEFKYEEGLYQSKSSTAIAQSERPPRG